MSSFLLSGMVDRSTEYMAGSAMIHAGHDRQARPELAQLPSLAVQADANGNTLDDLGEIAGGILRRQKRELRASSRSKALHRSVEFYTAQCVGFDDHPLTGGAYRDWLSIKFASTYSKEAGTTDMS